jgi:hypothetical protein
MWWKRIAPIALLVIAVWVCALVWPWRGKVQAQDSYAGMRVTTITCALPNDGGMTEAFFKEWRRAYNAGFRLKAAVSYPASNTAVLFLER